MADYQDLEWLPGVRDSTVRIRTSEELYTNSLVLEVRIKVPMTVVHDDVEVRRTVKHMMGYFNKGWGGTTRSAGALRVLADIMEGMGESPPDAPRPPTRSLDLGE